MSFWDDERAQAIQIGAVLLFAVLVIAFSLYQAFVVPSQNEQIEADHLQSVEGDMLDLRNGITTTPLSGDGRSIRVSLGTTYPARVIALNPPPPSGRLYTAGTDDGDVNVTLSNARALDDETRDYWDGTNRTRDSGSVVYAPEYNEFRDPPDLVYDNSALFRRFADAELWASGQTLIEGRELTLVALDGTYDKRSGQTAAVDLEAISASQTDVAITNVTGENVTVQFASMRSANAWESLLLEEEQFTNQSGYVTSVTGTPIPAAEYDLVTLELAQNETYDLRMAKVGLGTQMTDKDVTYITAVGPQNVSEGETFIAEVRDEFNNPVSGVKVQPNDTQCELSIKKTNERGRVRYQCEKSVRVNLEIKDGTQTNETVSFRIGSSSPSGAPEPSIDESATSVDRIQSVRGGFFNSVPISQYYFESSVTDNSGTGLDYVSFELRDSSDTVVTGGTYQLDDLASHDFSWYSPWFEDADLSGDPGNYDIKLTVMDNAGQSRTKIIGLDGTVETLSIESFGVQSQNHNNHARFDVQFEALSDVGIAQAEINLISVDSDSVVDTWSKSYDPVENSVSEDEGRAVEDNGGAGDEYIVRLILTDGDGNQVREARRVFG